jgi:hypothetical protein
MLAWILGNPGTRGFQVRDQEYPTQIIGRKSVCIPIYHPAQSNISTFEVKSPEIAPTQSTVDQFFSPLSQHLVECIGGVGSCEISEGPCFPPLPQQLIKFFHRPILIACTCVTFRHNQIHFIGIQAGTYFINSLFREIRSLPKCAATISLKKHQLSQIICTIGSIKITIDHTSA